MQVNGFVTVFAKKKSDRIIYTAAVSKKDEKGEYHNANLLCSFSKKAKERLKTIEYAKTKNNDTVRYSFEVVDGWLTVYVPQEGYNTVTLFVNSIGDVDTGIDPWAER